MSKRNLAILILITLYLCLLAVLFVAVYFAAIT